MSVLDARILAIRAMFDTSGHGLEVGPSHNPILAKSEGFDVDVLDHASAGELREKYAADPNVDISRIEEVDFIWDGRPICEVIGVSECYDHIVASHVLEHIPDMLGFLRECAVLLKPGGILFLAMPDKRRCFDVFRPLTSTGAVMQAHLEQRRVHAPATAFDFVANFASLGEATGWGAGDTGVLRTRHKLSFARAVFDRSTGSTEYFDFHAWVFTPSSFRLVLRDLYEVEALSLREVNFQLTSGVEFYMTLGKSGAGCAVSRLSLLHAVQDELREYPEVVPAPPSPVFVTRRSRLMAMVRRRLGG